jgi:hypothetical protein
VRLIHRLGGVLKGDEDEFFQIGLDRKANRAALMVVLLVGAAGSLSWWLQNENPAVSLSGFLPGMLAAWLVFGGSIHFIEMSFGGGGMSRRELWRLSGFAMLPLVLLGVPYVGWLSLVWFWGLMYRALRSFYAIKPGHAIFLIFTGSMVAFIVWGLTTVIVNTVVVSLLGA